MTDTRPSWDEWGLQLAAAVAARGDCRRRQVGAVLMRPDHTVVSTGYNGAPPGGPSCLAGECPRGLLTTDELPPDTSYDSGAGLCHAIHSEANCLLRASWDEMVGSTLYCTDKPCAGCQKLIDATPISRVVYPDGPDR